ncbi:Probable cytosol aminopeptidase {ECO:0000255/HAMAP-Rule:MF_00181} {ECO:0000255/HAMAP-Rule:MF_00181}; AltName: Full=Leucine aminopeptidase {ECO:0000255/HAMAP-Rule:MF_00181}; Short=LAP {ECO:0000255/HAMAP-Rule:MF_00181}; {ECO:0000255/HAMAP-Rule:MF_00181}; AltName: Full=Leucyl aminopeptidase {ECO:0000255/HAMAP-Rule:MF_00181} [Serendipita indica DSM 11827]|uniref:Probable Cytosol aminopeptidase n=1 Tax=Serendipita indica (strain DSM 11827) TaxID=1109443 RepID=G4T987_SERID|nr:Probable cytosol aminopeptidase {ECO:0000255/HAMAP-Rule:MF_00181} {ECO:0000255/HAMAP-Rule:MF_00181}; AltName: Full=Leucine aminopeptidase {ECO:0000255/HAMAP-Rule:MF_00181}; Short=LAP {ECO:0000255/HAMAP-Rule:MF_00181}; {ECO:0000255/HAMAP-Rule:MF_00181}; AltName: Full=Leucyl aminopeptidase {ECO:0000255/HAMAP-Rule:MF_00181} [Serendipita indica DSM 11827]CCA67861.1 probable Cytosol aminopeptidase [Serendipita indica DSM 11827]
MQRILRATKLFVPTARSMTSKASIDAVVVPVLSNGDISPLPPSLAGSVSAAAIWASTNAKASKAQETRVILQENAPTLSLVALGKDSNNENAKREAARRAVATGLKAARDAGARSIGIVTDKISEHDAAVSSNLALFNFSLQTKEKDPLMELPANMLTPTAFCERIVKEFQGLNNVEIHVRDKAWAEEKGMRVFLSVAQGTAQPPKFLEMQVAAPLFAHFLTDYSHYKGAKDPQARPLGLVGKGITFDSGGISLKPGAGMKLMRGDMGGAATTVSALLTIAKLGLPINVVLATPLTENMPGGRATKPGDVFTAMNGKTVEVDNTDAEGRLVLADALTYISREYKPHTLIDVATLTGQVPLLSCEIFTGVFSTSDALWDNLHAAGEAEFDRVWRMPLDEEFGPQIYNGMADLINTGGRPGGSCTAALFLKAFVDGIEGKDGQEPTVAWAHMDIAGTMESTRVTPYQGKGMTGRGVRALVEFARRLSARDLNDPYEQL